VLDLNRQEGRFIADEVQPEKVDLARRLWDYLQLDEN
jgi:outer membrane protein assembly factor BamD